MLLADLSLHLRFSGGSGMAGAKQDAEVRGQKGGPDPILKTVMLTFIKTR